MNAEQAKKEELDRAFRALSKEIAARERDRRMAARDRAPKYGSLLRLLP